MTCDDSGVRIREVQDDALDTLYALCAAELVHDRFSRRLLAEKLFANPRPNLDDYTVYLAETGAGPLGMMQSVTRPTEAKAWLGIFVVAAGHRRRGIATRLLETVATQWRRAGVKTAEALAIPGNYFMPGIDPRYTPALCFLEQHGFERFKDCVNMLADLSAPLPTAAEEERLRGIGVEVRRAGPEDSQLLDDFFAGDFGGDWRLEAELAMRNDPPALHIAVQGGRIIAFSAHSGQNREWGFFGPMGTTPAARGTGIGRLLLWHCLNDMRGAGHETSVIPWVGPIGFYARYVNARVDRVFWRYRRQFT
jgi:GNAT superfamily N-acetyltransferase